MNRKTPVSTYVEMINGSPVIIRVFQPARDGAARKNAPRKSTK